MVYGKEIVFVVGGRSDILIEGVDMLRGWNWVKIGGYNMMSNVSDIEVKKKLIIKGDE